MVQKFEQHGTVADKTRIGAPKSSNDSRCGSGRSTNCPPLQKMQVTVAVSKARHALGGL